MFRDKKPQTNEFAYNTGFKRMGENSCSSIAGKEIIKTATQEIKAVFKRRVPFSLLYMIRRIRLIFCVKMTVNNSSCGLSNLIKNLFQCRALLKTLFKPHHRCSFQCLQVKQQRNVFDISIILPVPI